MARRCSDTSWPQPSLEMASPRQLPRRVTAIVNPTCKADVLTTIARHAAATARVREAVTAAADSMSQYYKDSVKRAAGR